MAWNSRWVKTFPLSRWKHTNSRFFFFFVGHSQLLNLFIQAGTKKAAFSLQYFTITEFLEGKWGNRVAAINSTGGHRRQRRITSTITFP